ncbi:MAG: alanine dehydrogenase [Anaerolineae bacterium]|nr:alanine dehydrogenase [Anaerolineae bacterium]
MTAFATVGFPRMMKEQGEIRVFLPNFVQFVASFGATVFIEEGYGSRSGYLFDDYKLGNEAVHMCSHEEAYLRDVVIVLRSPSSEEFGLMRPGTVLLSMLHFPTRPKRVERLGSSGIKAISLDGIVNSQNIRLVENMRAVAWNGLEAAFDVLGGRWLELKRPDGRPIRVLILGAGMVGKHAVEAVTKLGNIERNAEHMIAGGSGAIATTVGRNVTGNPDLMKNLMQEADILVDATQRREPSKPVIPNDWVAWLPEHAIIADLAVDPYLLDGDPPIVRGVEGVPQGNLDQYVFAPDDPAWDQSVPPSIPSKHRRTVVSCYSWPGIHPLACMEHYARQLEPLIEVLMEKGYDDLAVSGGYFERALYRGTLKEWQNSGAYSPRPR